MSFDELRAAVLALPLEEKRKLAIEVLDTTGEAAQHPMPDWLFGECERRRKELEANPELGIPGEEFFRELESRYGI